MAPPWRNPRAPMASTSIELQPIVGAECAHCHERILVDTDGRNCKRCGVAVHRGECSKSHKGSCKGEAAAAAKAVTRHDYDEAAPLVFTPPVIAAFALPAFLAGFGVQRLLTAPEGEAAAAASTRVGLGAGSLFVAALAFAGAYFWAAGRQREQK